jgi:hypothetical protein
MTTYAAVSRILVTLAGSLALAFPLAAAAADNLPPETLAVKVFPDRYVAVGKQFADLAALEAWAKPIVLQELRLETCSSGAGKQLLAAAARFHDVYREAVLIRTRSPGEPAACASAAHAGAMPAVAGTRPDDREYLATNASGRSILP